MVGKPLIATYRWSSSDEADRIPVEDPATGEVIAVVQGGGPDQLINNYFRGVIGTPFGGTKHSGYGREHAIETLREFGLSA
jgi:acyl-CoA reductase-like NAD-dependent aldehyde dehydrogenase